MSRSGLQASSSAPHRGTRHRPDTRASFPPAQLRWLEQHFDLIAVTDEEALGVEVNTFTISPTEVVVAARSDRIAGELQARGSSRSESTTRR